MSSFQDALDYLNQFPLLSSERAAVDGLITQLIEANVFTYADQYEYERYILPRKDADHA